MNREQALAAMIPLAYLVGSIPFGLIVGRAKGIDPRTVGSGNIGATNLGRLLGAKYFALVFTLDILKSALPTLAAGAILNFHVVDQAESLLWILVGFAAVLGHVFPLYLKFKGGKGVATSAGVCLGLFPYFTLAGLAAIAVYVAVFAITRYSSVASMIGALAFPAAYALIGRLSGWPLAGSQLPLLIFSILVPVLIIWKHRGNIARLRAGTENRFRSKTL
jgi:glycerol-3-phosphate acyltransferase PlsY